jgi:tripartite-type tricarboxylate transporter receptor subunit TctC
VQRILAEPEMQSYFSPQLLQPMLGTPEQFAAVIKADAQKWGTIIRNAHLSLQ